MRPNSLAAGMLAAAMTVTLDLPALAAEAFTVQAVTIPETKAVFGQVQSRNVVPARARIGGTIREIGVSEGTHVNEGEQIAFIVDDKMALELAAAEAKIEALRSQLANAATELERSRQLLARGVTSQSRLDEAQTQYDVVANQVAAAEAEKSVVEQRTREGAVLAPTTGRVLTVPVTLGSVILPGDPIARVATGQYYLRLSLPERHAAEIEEGGSVQVGRRGLEPDPAAGDEPTQPGRIAKVYPEISDGRVVADVEVGDIGDYFVGERTMVRIPVGERTVLAVPPGAVVTRHGVDYLRVETDRGVAEIAVILGERLARDEQPLVEVLTGLREGDRVLLP